VIHCVAWDLSAPRKDAENTIFFENPTPTTTMTTILYICLALWLAKAAADTCVGLLRILACLAALLIGVALSLLARAGEMIRALWITAFPASLNN